jgi:hypothetical protein
MCVIQRLSLSLTGSLTELIGLVGRLLTYEGRIMRAWDLEHGSVHGLSIAPTAAASSANQTGVGVDFAQGSEMAHAILAIRNYVGALTLTIQEAPVDVIGQYVTTQTFTINSLDEAGTTPDPNTNDVFITTFSRSNRWMRAIVAGLNSSNVSVVLASQKVSDGGGSSVSPAGE